MTTPPNVNGESAAFIRDTNAVLRRLYGTDDWYAALHRANLVCEFMPAYIRNATLTRAQRRANREEYPISAYLENIETHVRDATEHYFRYQKIITRYIVELERISTP